MCLCGYWAVTLSPPHLGVAASLVDTMSLFLLSEAAEFLELFSGAQGCPTEQGMFSISRCGVLAAQSGCLFFHPCIEACLSSPIGFVLASIVHVATDFVVLAYLVASEDRAGVECSLFLFT